MSNVVVFIDSRVSNLQELIEGAQPGETVFVIDTGSDGVQQIADILAADEISPCPASADLRGKPGG